MSDEASDLGHAKLQAPSPAPLDHQPPALRDLAERARGYVEAASSANTRKAYAADLPEKDRPPLFSGHSLRAGLASSAEVDERHVQKQLGHASAEMTRRYQRRRDRFRINLTKAAGL